MEIEDEVDLLMSTDILAAQISTKSIYFVRAQSGWIFREDKKVTFILFAPFVLLIGSIQIYKNEKHSKGL